MEHWPNRIRSRSFPFLWSATWNVESNRRNICFVRKNPWERHPQRSNEPLSILGKIDTFRVANIGSWCRRTPNLTLLSCPRIRIALFTRQFQHHAIHGTLQQIESFSWKHEKRQFINILLLNTTIPEYILRNSKKGTFWNWSPIFFQFHRNKL